MTTDMYARTVCIVETSKDGEIEYWVAGMEPKKALVAVERLLDRGWKAAVTNIAMTSEQVAELKLRANGVQKLRLRR
jgi:hypothetical protein